jgi:hypothetical protein
MVAAFFVFVVTRIGFVAAGRSFGTVLKGFAVMAMPGVVAIVAGLVLRRGCSWKRDLGIVLLAGSGLTAIFETVVIVAGLEIGKQNNVSWVKGWLGVLFFLIVGGILFRCSVRKPSNIVLQQTDV